MNRSVVVGTALCALLLAPGGNAQDTPATVLVERTQCAETRFNEELRSLLFMELRSDGVVSLDEVAQPSTLARIELQGACDAPWVEVRIVDLATAKTVERSIPMDDVARSDRARVIALATASLLRASWSELAMATTPTGSVVVSATVQERSEQRLLARSQQIAHPAAPGPWISVGLDGMFFTATPTWLAGAHAALVYDWFRIGARVAGGTRPHPLGDIDGLLALLQLDAEVLTHAVDDAQFSLRLRGLGGYAYMTARSTRSDVYLASGHSAVFGASVVGEMLLRLDARVAIEFDLELGAMSGPNGRSMSERITTADGAFFGASVGLLAL